MRLNLTRNGKISEKFLKFFEIGEISQILKVGKFPENITAKNLTIPLEYSQAKEQFIHRNFRNNPLPKMHSIT